MPADEVELTLVSVPCFAEELLAGADKGALTAGALGAAQRPGSHCGLNADVIKSKASATVVAWQNRIQSFLNMRVGSGCRRKRKGIVMVKREVLQDWLHMELQVASFKDYCPNGLQVEGKSRISRLACAVTASRYAIERAIDEKADALLVHHGLFWRNDDPSVVGVLRGRLVPALKAGLNIYAYHLPLDAHPQWGNNIQLARALGLTPLFRSPPEPVSPGSLVWQGELKKSMSAQAFGRQVLRRLERAPTLVVPVGGGEAVSTIAWCTGGAQGYLPQAAAAGAQLYLSGEISEPTTHLARELGVVYCAAGHHATERYGVQAVASELAQQFALHTWFIDEDNPA